MSFSMAMIYGVIAMISLSFIIYDISGFDLRGSGSFIYGTPLFFVLVRLFFRCNKQIRYYRLRDYYDEP